MGLLICTGKAIDLLKPSGPQRAAYKPYCSINKRDGSQDLVVSPGEDKHHTSILHAQLHNGQRRAFTYLEIKCLKGIAASWRCRSSSRMSHSFTIRPSACSICISCTAKQHHTLIVVLPSMKGVAFEVSGMVQPA